MDLAEQFNLIAKEYDANRRKFIPCFDDFYQATTSFVTSNLRSPQKIVDLGAGTGLLTYYWYRAFPESQYVLTDIAEDMLEVAKKRFADLQNFTYRVCDYSENFPEIQSDAVISALSIHHLENLAKERLFSNVYRSLNEEGVFVNYDQFCAGSQQMNRWFDEFWANSLTRGELTERDLALWKKRRLLDRECSVEEEISMLKKCGFREVKCVYTYQKFSVIVSIK